MTVRANRGSRSVSVATRSRPVSAGLLLEEVVERAPDVARARRVGRSVTLHRDAQRERGARVGGVLVGDPLGDRLRAFEAPAGLEVRALATGMDGRAAIRALLE